MLKISGISAIAAVCSIAFSLFCSAAAIGAEMRQHDSHVHGSGQMNIAIDQQAVYVEIASPAANVVGFEHAPETEQERQTLQEAIAQLQKGGQLFAFTPAADCRLVEAAVETDIKTEEDDHEAHDDHNAQDKQKAHDDHEVHDDHEAHGGHADIEAEYRFECAQSDKLTTIEVLLFTKFPNFAELDVQLIGPAGQNAYELTAKKNRLEL